MRGNSNQSREVSYLRNRIIATFVFLLSLTVTIVSLILEWRLGSSLPVETIQFVSEAMLIASVADGIAIYALSNQINLPVMHTFTGLIQNKRKNIIDGVMAASKLQFFPKDTIMNIIRQVDILEIARIQLSRAAQKDNSQIIGRVISSALRKNANSLSVLVEKNLLSAMGRMNVNQLLDHLLKKAESGGWISQGLEKILQGIIGWLKKPEFKKMITQELLKVANQKKMEGGFLKRLFTKSAVKVMERTDTINYEELASEIQITLVDLIQTMLEESKQKEVGQRWLVIKQAVISTMSNLKGNEEVISHLNAWKNQLLAGGTLQAVVERVILQLSDKIEDGKITKIEMGQATKYIQTAIRQRDGQTIDLGHWVLQTIQVGLNRIEKGNVDIQTEFEKLIYRLIETEYDDAMALMKELLEKLTDEDLVKTVNDIAGGNLQWLRISGAYVGAAVGLFLFLVMRYPLIGLPLMAIFLLVLKLSKRARNKLVKYQADEGDTPSPLAGLKL